MDQLYITKLQLAEIQSLPANRSGPFVFMFSMIFSLKLNTCMETSVKSCHLNLTSFTVFKMSGTVLFPVQDVRELITELKHQIQEIETPSIADSWESSERNWLNTIVWFPSGKSILFSSIVDSWINIRFLHKKEEFISSCHRKFWMFGMYHGPLIMFKIGHLLAPRDLQEPSASALYVNRCC